MINDELTRIENAKKDIKTSIENKGVTIPEGTKIDKMNVFIDEINQSGGAGVQSDWDMNDSTNPAYVKNRPFYKEVKETEIMAETTINVSAEGSQMLCEYVAKLGEELTIEIDHVVYKVVAKDVGGMIGFGNLSLAGMGEDTGEPFVVAHQPAYKSWIIMMPTTGNHVVKIVANAENYTKIPIEYMPEIDNTVTFVSNIRNWNDGEWEKYGNALALGKNVCQVDRQGEIIERVLFIDKTLKGAVSVNKHRLIVYDKGFEYGTKYVQLEHIADLTNDGVGADYIYLKSPDGKSHAVSVNNEGQLVVE